MLCLDDMTQVIKPLTHFPYVINEWVMKRKYFLKTLIPLVFSMYLFAGCNSNYQKKDFESLMVSMGKKDWKTIEFSEQMYNDTAFMEIYDHSKFYYDDMILFLKNNNFEDTLKYSPICIRNSIWAMQNLPLKQYVGFCDTIFTLFNNGKITNDELFEVISPNFGGKYILRENYKNADVINFLGRVKNNQKTSDSLRKEVDEILAGKYN